MKRRELHVHHPVVPVSITEVWRRQDGLGLVDRIGKQLSKDVTSDEQIRRPIRAVLWIAKDPLVDHRNPLSHRLIRCLCGGKVANVLGSTGNCGDLRHRPEVLDDGVLEPTALFKDELGEVCAGIEARSLVVTQVAPLLAIQVEPV
jgi:hypothetical protein